MHREIRHADHAFHQESNASLYFLTGLLGLLIGADVWPALAGWLGEWGLSLPSWPRELYPGYRWALIAAIIGGARVLYTSLEGLFEGRMGADLALAIACIAAILFRKPLVAAEVVFIGMVGECLESFTFERTQRAIRKIVEVFPRRCWLLRDGQEVRVFARDLQVGDRVLVKPGARIPADGVVIEGRSAVDTSSLTGETFPVEKGPGDSVLAGTLNQFGALVIESQRVGEQTVVGRVIELTVRALKDKVSLERTADRLARYFLPIVLGLAALTFVVGVLLNMGLLTATKRGLSEAIRLSVDPTLAVLVVACPCALILATPAAVMAALARLAGTGVLIKGGSALERLAEVSAVAFDKTGTLTEGRLELGDIVAFDDVTPEQLLAIAATAEQRSEHLLARLIVQEARDHQLSLEAIDEFQSHPGAGVTAKTVEETIVVGTRRLLDEQNIAISSEAAGRLETLEASGQTLLMVARGGRLIGAIGARDRARPEAGNVISELCRIGINDIALLTGDRLTVAHAIASSVGISEVHAELLPQQKAEFVERWRSAANGARRRVAMVGDGINDAPALACADVGLAIGGTGADVAAEAGDVVLMGDPLRTLPLLVRLSRETLRIIRQNILIFAFGVNAVGIVLTAWLWPLFATSPEWYEQAPLAAVVYHQFGSLAVLLNSMRLLWFERSSPHPALLALRVRAAKLDRWLERFSIHDGIHWIEDHAKPVAFAAIVLIVAAYALSGLVQIAPDEVGVIQRFGRPVTILDPGLHWRWPWPIEATLRVQPDRVRVVEVGFRSAPGKTTPTAGMSWASSHGDGVTRLPEEAMMLTGDGNLIEIQATIRYAIRRDQLLRYSFEVRDPDEIVRAATESVLRETLAKRSFLDVLTIGRERFQDEVLAQVRQRCDADGASGLGVRFDGFSLHDVHPPSEVVPDYHRVTEAMELRDKQINVAVAETMRIPQGSQQSLPGTRAAEVKKKQIVLEAEAAAFEKIKNADAERARFLSRHRARSALSLAQEWQLVRQAAEAVQRGQAVGDAYRDYERRRRDLLAVQTMVTDFRLYWDALGKALTGREKILIDAEKIHGRRHMLMFDPDQLRVPVPTITSPPKDMRRSPMPNE